ncbi:hypothetical protein HK100_005983 [Physocladia obscura]|uniref:Cation efflux protein transmembrane domain-containing protein n=1 Tax=Physocladia obscura TaxID=109957 RepID=A0AAD5XIP9_9FUNG|nr:hypothetical protein HK100_005983 [Physocladia obscura]
MTTLLDVNGGELPLHVRYTTYSGTDKGERQGRGVVRLTALITRYIRAVASDSATRKVFFFLILNLGFTVVEFLYGFWANSLGLLSDAVHMLFDCSALILSLWASQVAKWPKNDAFSFGFARVETVAGFANAFALMLSPPDINTDSLLVVSILGLLVNIVGIFAFDHGGMGHDHSSHGHSHSQSHDYTPPPVDYHTDHDDHSHSHSHGGSSSGVSHQAHRDSLSFSNSSGHDSHAHNNPLMHGIKAMNRKRWILSVKLSETKFCEARMFLHVLSDTLGSVGVIISTLLIKYLNWTWSDPFVSLIIALLTLASVYPLLKSSTHTLLQRTPPALEALLPACYTRIMRVRGVVGYTAPHFWELAAGKNVGSIKIQVSGTDVNPDLVRIAVVAVFREAGVNELVVQIERDIVEGY